MNSFTLKYIISILVIGVIMLFTDNIKTACLLFLAGCIVILAIAESFTVDWEETKKVKKNETTYKKVDVSVHVLPSRNS
ncbi:hypothetical protein [Veillonella sp. 3310]|uniref:hypothetical protein n=1 Tax=Veillonella sp. 3310 TaxID=2490956 RepID=UPI000FD681D0|nr:hypothetical protein [Veillonella sp. 3310]